MIPTVPTRTRPDRMPRRHVDRRRRRSELPKDDAADPGLPGRVVVILPDILVDLFGGPKRLPAGDDAAQPAAVRRAEPGRPLRLGRRRAPAPRSRSAAAPVTRCDGDPAGRCRCRRKPAAGRLAARGHRRLRPRRSAGHHRRRRRRRRRTSPPVSACKSARSAFRPCSASRSCASAFPRPAGRHRAGAACRRRPRAWRACPTTSTTCSRPAAIVNYAFKRISLDSDARQRRATSASPSSTPRSTRRIRRSTASIAEEYRRHARRRAGRTATTAPRSPG